MPDNIITLNQELIHTELKDLVRNSVEETLNSLLDAILSIVFRKFSSNNNRPPVGTLAGGKLHS